MSKIPFVSGVDMSAEYNAALCLACRFSCADYIVSLSFREKRIEKLFIKQKGYEKSYLSFGYDEHVWLSVKNAEVLSKAIADALEKADPDHKDIYQENASAYSEKLKDLDAKYQEVVDGASQKTLLFGDRFPGR